MIKNKKKAIICTILQAMLLMPTINVYAVTFPVLDIAKSPLATSTGSSIKPNLLFIFDNSGSMDWSYLPDYVTDSYCPGGNNSFDQCGDQTGKIIYPPFYSASYNLKYYDPNVYYFPPNNYNSAKQADGSYSNSFANQDPTNVHINGFNSSTGEKDSKVDITTNYPELYWCDTDSGINSYPYSGNTHCVRETDNTTVKYPDTTYKYPKMNAYWCTNATDNPLIFTKIGSTITNVTVNSNCTSFRDMGDQSSRLYLKTTTSTPAQYYSMPNLLWCASANSYSITNLTYNDCQAQRDANHKFPSFGYSAVVPSVAKVDGIPASKAITFKLTGSKTTGKTTSTSSITIKDNTSGSIIATATCSYNNTSGSSKLPDTVALNSCATNIAAATVQLPGWKIVNTSGTGVITIYAPPGDNPNTSQNNTAYNNKKVNVKVQTTADNGVLSTSDTGSNGNFNLSGAQEYVAPITGQTISASLKKIEIVSGKTYPKSSSRTDCVSSTTTCSYQEEIQNFANWLAYYHKRMDTMKSSISRALVSVTNTTPGAGFRIGLNILNTSGSNATPVSIGDFDNTKKQSFYTQLFKITQSGSTPLRGALYEAGMLYAGKKIDGSALNSANDPVQKSCQPNFTMLTTDGYWNQNVNSTTDLYNGSSITFKDLNSTTLTDQDGNESGAKKDALAKSVTLADIALYFYKTDLRPGMTNNVATTDGQIQQHMTTFTLGLGLSGYVSYNKDYLSGASSDYNKIINGQKNWGDPIANSDETRVDDLWHAAVNGGGQYFSASNPADIYNSFSKTIIAATAITGSGAAAATSNLEPVAGDNYIYTASYTTNDWFGSLERKTINLDTGAISSASDWEAGSLLDTKMSSNPSSRVVYTFDTSAGTNTRDKKLTLNWTTVNANTTLKNYFDPNQLSQCISGTCSGQTNQNLFQFLMGDNSVNPNSSYRSRIHILGDIVDSQPVYMSIPSFSYNDTGYAAWAIDPIQVNRTKAVFVGSNDGMLHAFNGDTGQELWSYVPNNVLSKIYKLADKSYPSNHDYYVDGKLTLGDVYDSKAKAWKTILVGGLGGGGKAYFAIDVTDPTTPQVLWELTDASIGYSYGNPIITKLSDGSWVTLLTSGYNNNATGKLHVVDAITGSIKFSLSTGGANNSGLAKIAAKVKDSKNNTVEYVYGGDLNGDMYKFTIGTSAASSSVFKMVSTGEPITAKPVISVVTTGGTTIPVIAFGTGIFLQESDKSDTNVRHIIAIKDDPNNNTTKTNIFAANSSFVKQEFSTLDGNGGQRTLTGNAVDWNNKDGWYIPLPDSGERATVEPKLQLGTLIIPTNVPTTTPDDCSSGGYSWINNIDILTGSYVPSSNNSTHVAGEKITGALAVGINVIRLPNGKVISITTTSDNNHPTKDVYIGGTSGTVKRVSWREIITK